eukprot:symbB.v1.2.000514.t2/scaffold31.1/size418471/10
MKSPQQQRMLTDEEVFTLAPCHALMSSFYGTGKASKNSWLSPKEVDELVGGDGGSTSPRNEHNAKLHPSTQSTQAPERTKSTSQSFYAYGPPGTPHSDFVRIVSSKLPYHARPDRPSRTLNDWIASTTSVPEVLSLVASYGSEFDGTNTATALHRLAKWYREVPDARLFQDRRWHETLDHLDRNMQAPAFQTRHLTSSLWSFATMGRPAPYCPGRLFHDAMQAFVQPVLTSQPSGALLHDDSQKTILRKADTMMGFEDMVSEPQREDAHSELLAKLSQLYNQKEVQIENLNQEVSRLQGRLVRMSMENADLKSSVPPTPIAFRHEELTNHPLVEAEDAEEDGEEVPKERLETEAGNGDVPPSSLDHPNLDACQLPSDFFDGSEVGKIVRKVELLPRWSERVSWEAARIASANISDAPRDDADVTDAVVKVFAAVSEPNYAVPWVYKPQDARTGTAFAVWWGNSISTWDLFTTFHIIKVLVASECNRWLLTNAHVIRHAAVIQVRKRGDHQKFIAKVLCLGVDCDLAILTVEDRSFWNALPRVRLMLAFKMRIALGLKRGQSGIRIRRVEPASPASKVLEAGDIVLKVQGSEIGDDGKVPFRGTRNERIDFHYLISQLFVGDTCDFTILRKQRKRNNFHKEAPISMISQWTDGLRDSDDHEIIVLSQVLASPLTVGFTDFYNVLLHKFNGQKVKNLEHLMRMVKASKEEYFQFEIERNNLIILSRKEVPRSECNLEAGKLDSEGNKDGVERQGCQRFILLPSDPKRMAWDLTGMVLLVYDMIVIPISAFEPEETMFTIFMEWTTQIFWTFDVVMSLLTGYVHKGQLVMSPWAILIHYLKTWFVLDLVVVGPDWVMTFIQLSAPTDEEGGTSGSVSRLMRSIRVVRTVRLLRLVKLKRVIDMAKDRITSEVVFILLNILKLIVLLLLVNHFVASLWYLMGGVANPGQLNWRDVYGMQPQQQSIEYRYATALHWSLTQFTPATVDVHPQNLVERTFAILVLIFGLVLFSSFVSSITASMTQLRNMQEDKSKQFWLLRRYLLQKKVPQELNFKVLRYTEYATSRSGEAIPEHRITILNVLTKQLQSELRFVTHFGCVKQHGFLRLVCVMNESILHLMSSGKALVLKALASQDPLFEVVDPPFCMYFVEQGQIQYTQGQSGALASGTFAPNAFESEGFLPTDPDVLMPATPTEAGTAIGKGGNLCEIALWAHWKHVGSARAVYESNIVQVIAKGFADCIRRDPAVDSMAAMYARMFVKMVNDPDRILEDEQDC